jgi:flavin reductase (DIM6/NTAB) family NADH-FMN oxidoreductase RutF
VDSVLYVFELPASASPHPDGPGPLDGVDGPDGVDGSDGVDADTFRAAMARLAAGVVLITARDPDDGPRGEDVGMTATAFMSVSLDPPLAMVSVRVDSRMDELLERQPLWAASVLGESHRHIAGWFAMRGRVSDRLLFADLDHGSGEASGSPVLGSALAVVECRTEQRVRAGDHTLVIGRVLAARTPSAAESGPLLYFRGRYRFLR